MKGIIRHLLPLSLVASAALATAPPPSAPPEFTHHEASDWINSDPLTLAALKGKVVMVEFWAFDCANCLNSRKWIDSVERKSAQGLVIVGVHTPELPQERDPDAVRKAVKRLNIDYPVMIDGDSSYWKALHSEMWPTFCLIGRDGLLYACVRGEMHVGDERAKSVDAVIDALLKQPA